ncbi:hypothetical protein NPIL_475751 [Nephila pilipes]|uniref:Uncharacterized protein n=1 Tax=Nephila pilipes TaxID=299642 RepID=A0A8X6II95_NEPPI|nr:hypothetical protein NPIL_475751 [Nephila pilipes]
MATNDIDATTGCCHMSAHAHLPHALSRVLCCINIFIILCYTLVSPYQYFEQLLHNLKIGVDAQCLVSASYNDSFIKLLIQNQYVQNQFNLSVDPFTKDERLLGYFQQNGATAYTAFTTLSQVSELFGEKSTFNRSSKISWPPRSPDLPSCDFHLRGKLKGQVHSNNPHTRSQHRRQWWPFSAFYVIGSSVDN